MWGPGCSLGNEALLPPPCVMAMALPSSTQNRQHLPLSAEAEEEQHRVCGRQLPGDQQIPAELGIGHSHPTFPGGPRAPVDPCPA